MGFDKTTRRLSVDRVVVDMSGTAVRPDTAFIGYGIITEVMFIRDDGWVLGAPFEYESAAESLWRDHWEFTMRMPKWKLELYDGSTRQE